MSLPHSVPKYRHLPDTSRFKADTTCAILPSTMMGDKAERRNADQIAKQTSGEYGKFLVDHHHRSEKLNLGKSQHKLNEMSGKFKFDISTARSEQSTARSSRTSSVGTRKPFYEPMTTERYKSDVLDNVTPIELHTLSSSHQLSQSTLSSYESSGANMKDTFKNTLDNLDKQYQNRNKRDLRASLLPSRGYQEGKLCATSNHRNEQQSKVWSNQLRQDKSVLAVSKLNM